MFSSKDALVHLLMLPGYYLPAFVFVVPIFVKELTSLLSVYPSTSIGVILFLPYGFRMFLSTNYGECGREVKKRVQVGQNGWRRLSGLMCDRRVPVRVKGNSTWWWVIPHESCQTEIPGT